MMSITKKCQNFLHEIIDKDVYDDLTDSFSKNLIYFLNARK